MSKKYDYFDDNPDYTELMNDLPVEDIDEPIINSHLNNSKKLPDEENLSISLKDLIQSNESILISDKDKDKVNIDTKSSEKKESSNNTKFTSNPPEFTQWKWNNKNKDRFNIKNDDVKFARYHYLVNKLKNPEYTLAKMTNLFKSASITRNDFDRNLYLAYDYLWYLVNSKKSSVAIYMYSQESADQVIFDMISLGITSYMYDLDQPGVYMEHMCKDIKSNNHQLIVGLNKYVANKSKLTYQNSPDLAKFQDYLKDKVNYKFEIIDHKNIKPSYIREGMI